MKNFIKDGGIYCILTVCLITTIWFALALYDRLGKWEHGEIPPHLIPSKTIESVLEAEKGGRIEVTTITITNESGTTTDTLKYRICPLPQP